MDSAAVGTRKSRRTYGPIGLTVTITTTELKWTRSVDNKAALPQVWDRARIRFDNDEGLRHQHKAWLRLTKPLGLVEDTAVLAAPNDFVRDYLDKHLRPYLADVLSEELGQDVQVAVTVQSGDEPGDGEHLDPSAIDPASTLDADGWTPRKPDVRHNGGSANGGANGASVHHLGTRDLGTRVTSLGPDRVGPVLGFDRSDFDRSDKDARGARLNPKYTFDTFVIGSSNRFTAAAAVAVAEAPARAYNPLFIYGDSGLGKTHLLHAIGHYAQRLLPGLRTRYVSSEEFTNDFINSVRDDKMQAFQTRYRSVDVLLIDDIQFLERAERTQEEFFHTFNTLHNANKQIVISSDKSPRQFNMIEDRLRTRFEWGLISDVQAPDLETRIAILRKKAAQEEIEFPAEVLQFIASRIQSNIRELEGAMIRVTAFASLSQQKVDMSLTEMVLKDLVGELDAPEITASTIMGITAEYFTVSVDDMVGPSRSRAIVHARQMAMYLCRELTDLSLPRIGEKFGGRDHTTVMHAERKIKTQMTEKLTTYTQIAELTSRIKLRSRT